MVDPQYIAFDMLNNGLQDDILNQGEFMIEKNEKLKGYPSLAGLES